MTSALVVSRDDAVLTLRLNRPERLNALDASTADALVSALRAARVDESLRCVVITGTGRGFCAGADTSVDLPVPELLGAARRGEDPDGLPSSGGAVPMLDRANALAVAVAQLPMPVIAAVNGVAVGLGVSLALGCDVVAMTDSAQLILGFASVGLLPDAGATYLLAQRLGRGRALGMALLGDRVSASVALAEGVANRVFTDQSFDADVAVLAQQLAAGPPAALRSVKAAIWRGRTTDLRAALEYETDEQLLLLRQTAFAHSPH